MSLQHNPCKPAAETASWQINTNWCVVSSMPDVILIHLQLTANSYVRSTAFVLVGQQLNAQ